MVKGKAMVALVLLVEETAGWILSVVKAVVATVVGISGRFRSCGAYGELGDGGREGERMWSREWWKRARGRSA